MVTIEQVIYIVPILALTTSILYYALNLRASNKTQQLQLETRQTQLFMNLYETYRSPEFRKVQMKIQTLEYTDFRDFWSKYGRDSNPDFWAEWFSVAAFYNGIGVLVRRNMLDINLVEELLSNIVIHSWEMMGDIILEWRKVIVTDMERRYDMLHGFEYLYNEIIARGTIRPNPL